MHGHRTRQTGQKDDEHSFNLNGMRIYGVLEEMLLTDLN